MKLIEKIINILKEDICEFNYKNRTKNQQIELVIDMLGETKKLEKLLEETKKLLTEQRAEELLEKKDND